MKEEKNLQDALTSPGIVPVIRLKSGEKLPRLLETFQVAGIRAVELTMTMPDAPGLLRENRRRFGDSLVIGMGTVTDEITAQQALDSGAQFLVSPFPVPAALTLAKAQNVPMVMGAFSPLEVFSVYRLGADFVKVFSTIAKKPIDCHLMVTDPDDFIETLAKAGAGYICPHAETINRDAFRILNKIESLGCKTGVVLNPATPLSYIQHYIHRIDKLTIMSVDPGFAGRWQQAMGKIEERKQKIEELRAAGTPEIDLWPAVMEASDAIKKSFDYAFGAPVSEAFFGGA